MIDTADSWATTNSTRQANGAAGNQVDYVMGVQEDVVEAEVVAEGNAAANVAMAMGVGIDSTTVISGFRAGFSVATTRMVTSCVYRGLPGIGHHSLVWMENANNTTALWYGDAGSTRVQSGLSAVIWG